MVVAKVVRPIPVTRFTGMSREEVAAIKIQTTFRGYLARRALRALRGLVRLKSLVEGATVKRQTTNTLRSMQGISRVQSQINNRRIRMTEENQALQRQLLAKELESLQAISSPVLSAVGERYYKVTAEALRVCEELVSVVRPNVESGTVYLQRCDSPNTTASSSKHNHQTNQTVAMLQDLNFARSTKKSLNLFN